MWGKWHGRGEHLGEGRGGRGARGGSRELLRQGNGGARICRTVSLQDCVQSQALRHTLCTVRLAVCIIVPGYLHIIHSDATADPSKGDCLGAATCSPASIADGAYLGLPSGHGAIHISSVKSRLQGTPHICSLILCTARCNFPVSGNYGCHSRLQSGTLR